MNWQKRKGWARKSRENGCYRQYKVDLEPQSGRMRIHASEDSLIVSLRAGLLDDPGPHPGVGGDPLGKLLRSRSDDVHALG